MGNRHLKKFYFPRLGIYFDLGDLCSERIGKSRFQFELFEKEQALAKVWKNYEQLAKKFENVYIINGGKVRKRFFRILKI